MPAHNNASGLNFLTEECDDAKRSRAWCFTHFNYTQESLGKIKKIDCQYMVFGREVCPTTGRPHVQGYVYFVCQKSWSKVKKIFAGAMQAHVEPAKGDAESNRVYCTKEDPGFFEKGVKPATQAEKGKKGADKIKAQWALAKDGKFEELPPASIKTYEYIHAKYGPPPADRETLDNVWIWGATGVGKSRSVREENKSFYSKPMSKWWDGYSGESCVVLDDFAPEHAKYLTYYLKIWADHYVFNAEVKGGMLRIRPKRVIVTSQYSPEQCWGDDPESLSAIRRRFTVRHLVSSEAEDVARDPPRGDVGRPGRVLAEGVRLLDIN